MTFTDLAKSFARTVIPYLVGLIVAQAFRVGLDLHGYEAQVTVGVGSCYFAVARLAEHYLSPQFGWLLGVAGAPVYGSKARRLKARTIKTKPSFGTHTVQVHVDNTQVLAAIREVTIEAQKLSDVITAATKTAKTRKH